MHSHLLPNLDDGVKSFDESIVVIRKLKEYGYEKAVTTPHIMNDTYRNTPEGILHRLNELKEYLVANGVEFEVEAAAEYYLDEAMAQRFESGERLLTFGNRYLLFETNYITEPYLLKEFVFKAITNGYKPILAHPERYHFMTMEKAEELMDRGVLLQINLLSLSGYYGKPIQRLAEKMIEKQWVNFLGTDCHNPEHARLLKHAIQTKAFRKALDLPLLNNTL